MRRSVHTAVTAFVILIAVAACAAAQSPTPAPKKTPGFELLTPGGTVAPVGDRDKTVKRGMVTAIQGSYGLRPDLVITSTVAWTKTRPIGMGSDAKLDLFTYDLGAECRLPRKSTDGPVNVKPFIGIGAGARTSNYRHVDVATTNEAMAYASAGAEVGLGRVRLRVEVRDYVATQRNDVAVLTGLRLVFR